MFGAANVPSMATTGLHLAAAKGDMAGAQARLQAGDPVDQPDQHGNAALHHAAKGGHAALIQMLAGARANVNLQAPTTLATPLVFAAQSGHAAAVQQLLGLGAQPALATRKGKTALTVAQEKNHQQVVAVLSQARVRCCDVYMPHYARCDVLHCAPCAGPADALLSLSPSLAYY